MTKGLILLYFVIFGCYILWSRQPDYFDGEKYPATIKMEMDSIVKKVIPKAVYLIGGNAYSVSAVYPLVNYDLYEKVEVIVEREHPNRAVVYRFWGYWITWGELLTSIVMAILLFQVAVSITKNPTPEALMEQLSYKPEKKTKYGD